MMPKTVMIADDDKDLLAVLEMRCRQLGLEVLTAEDGLTALSTADFALPHLVILDVSMPGGNGLAVCEMMLDDDRLAKIPVIILTGRKDAETRRRCQTMNAHYVCKGTDVWGQVEPLIERLLGLPHLAISC